MTDTRFNFDRTVSISLLVAVFIETAGALVWAGTADTRIKMLERRGLDSIEIAERLVRLETQMDDIEVTLIRIEERLNDDD